MVTQMGFSEALGNVDLESNYARLSSETKQKIESEVQRLVDEGRQQAKRVLNARRAELELVAKALLEYEMLSLDEVNKVLRGEKLPKMAANSAAAVKAPGTSSPPPPAPPSGIMSPPSLPPVSIPGLPPIPESNAAPEKAPVPGGNGPPASGA